MKEKLKFAMVAAMLMSLAGLAWLLPLRAFLEGSHYSTTLLTMLLAVTISALTALLIRHEHRNAKAGYPLADERSKATILVAGHYAFFTCATLTLVVFAYSVSGADWFGQQEMQAPDALLGILTIMVSVYLGIWTLLTYRGRIE